MKGTCSSHPSGVPHAAWPLRAQQSVPIFISFCIYLAQSLCSSQGLEAELMLRVIKNLVSQVIYTILVTGWDKSAVEKLSRSFKSNASSSPAGNIEYIRMAPNYTKFLFTSLNY